MGDPPIEPRPGETWTAWSLLRRVAFRFCFLYFTLYTVFTQALGILFPWRPGFVRSLGDFAPLRRLVLWTGISVFGLDRGRVFARGGGSGDTTSEWIKVLCLVALAVLGTIIWSVLDRRRADDAGLHRWLRVGVRFALGSTMLSYGFSKVFLLQMSSPTPSRLVEPFGNFSPMGILWYSIGASPAFQILLGCAEVLSGVLILLPRTATLGALLCFAGAAQVFILNMTYDVPVKLFSFHLLLFASFLLAAEARRLLAFFFAERAVDRSSLQDLFQSARLDAIARAAQVVFAAVLVLSYGSAAKRTWEVRQREPRSPLYGIWNVESLSLDGEVRPPLLTDPQRWRRVMFQPRDAAVFQRMDDSFEVYRGFVNASDRKVALVYAEDRRRNAELSFDGPSLDRLVLDGKMDGQRIHMELRRVDERSLVLPSSGFHWIQDYPLVK